LIRIIYTRRAEEELRSIWRYIAEDNDNEPAADRILLAIGAKIELLRNQCTVTAIPCPPQFRKLRSISSG
jgi:plasmid stabilization system protein ParE